MSEEKEAVEVIVEQSGGPKTVLGTLIIDLDVPCDVAREYIRRTFREQLNTICCDAFQFVELNSDGDMEKLDRDRELTSWLHGFLQRVKDPMTGVEKFAIIIQADDMAEQVPIEEVFSEDEEEEEILDGLDEELFNV
jgi:hypothetical protein